MRRTAAPNLPLHRPRALFAWLIVLCVGLLAAMALPMFLGRVYTADDLGAFHLPIRAFYARCLAAGNPFDWSPQLYCGFYLTGEGQLGGYHPLHLLLYRFLPLGIAFDLECLISYPLMLAGTYFFLRRWRLPREAALFGAITFSFSGFSLLHFVHLNAVAVVAHLPWLLLAIDVLLRNIGIQSRQSVFAGAAIALLTASQLLLGYPQYVVYSLLAEISYSAVVIAYAPNDKLATAEKPANRVGSSLAPLFWIGLGVAIAAIQLLPTWEALGESSRQAADASFHNSGSLHPLNFVQLLAPYLFRMRVAGQNTHELGCYAGAVTLLLAAWCIFGPRNSRRVRPLVAAAVGILILGVVIATGEFGPIAKLTEWLPIMNRMRFPCRAIALIHFGLAILASTGLAKLLYRSGDDRRGLKAIWTLFGLSIILAIVGPRMWQPYVATPALVWTGPALVGTAALLITLICRGARSAKFALLLLAAADLGVYGLTNSFYSQTKPLADYVRTTRAPPGQLSGRVALDLDAPNERVVHAGNRLNLSGWSLADGYAGLEPARKLDLRQTASLRAANVAWIAVTDPAKSGWKQLTSSLPRAQLFTTAIATSSPNVAINRIPLKTTALVEQPIDLESGPAGQVRILTDQPGFIRLHCQPSGRQLLFVSESFHPGWKCTINGAPQPVLRVDGDFLGCVCPPGDADVCLDFRPESLRIGRIVSLFGLGLLGAIVGLQVLRRDRVPIAD